MAIDYGKPLEPRGPVPYTVKDDGLPLKNRKTPITLEVIHEMALKVRNWGKWGPNDEIGTLNYATPDMVAKAAKLVRHGKTFPLAIPLGMDGPQTGNLVALLPGPAQPQESWTVVAVECLDQAAL